MKADLATTPARSVIGHLNGRSLNKFFKVRLGKAINRPAARSAWTFGLGAAALPVRKDRRVIFDLPPVNSLEDAAKIASAVLTAVATGELTPADASEICKLIDTGEGFRDGRAG
jgi:hypothetical protein